MNAENTRSKARRDAEQPTLESVKQSKDMERHKRQTLNTLVGEQVLHALGQPRNLLKVQVRPLWDGNYRANVFVGAHAADMKIPYSYFVVADGDGNVFHTSPKIHKQY